MINVIKITIFIIDKIDVGALEMVIYVHEYTY